MMPPLLFNELMAVVPWRAERRQMYDRVLDVPRLVSFHDLTTEPPPHPAITRLRRRLNDVYAGELGEPFTTAGLCLYRDGSDSVAWHGDTIGRSSSAGHDGGDRQPGRHAGFRDAATRWRFVAAAAAGPRRPARDGRFLPAHLGALRYPRRPYRRARGSASSSGHATCADLSPESPSLRRRADHGRAGCSPAPPARRAAPADWR